MKTLHRISLVFIAVPLIAILWSSLPLVAFVQPVSTDIANASPHQLFAGFHTGVHEIGFARLTVAGTGLLILFIPYRKSEAWACAALAVLMIWCVLPAGFFPSMTNLGRWPILREFSSGPRAIGLAAANLVRHLFPALTFAGLAIVPYFITSRRNTEWKDLQTP